MLVVGQNPGSEEDLAGQCFIGPSGKLLDAMITDAGFTRKDVRYTNAVRCITPRVKNKLREPLPAEVSACRTHLIAEVQERKPKVIIAMGGTALLALTGLGGVMGKRGQPVPLLADFEYDCEVYPTMHPAFVLRTPMSRATVVSDVRRVRDVGKPQEKIDWTYAPGVVEGEAFAYDIETYDEEGNIRPEMTELAVASAAGVIVSKSPAQAADMARRLRNAPLPAVSHFGWDFDDKRTGIHSDYDTAALAYLDDETQPLGLESLAVKYLGVRGWKEARDGARLGTPELAEYNARDALYTLRLFLHFKSQLGDSRNGVPRITIAEQILRPLRSALDVCTNVGIFVNAEEVEKERVKQAERIVNVRGDLQAILREWGIPDDLFNKKLKTKVKEIPFNPNSNDHVAVILRRLGYGKMLPPTKSGKDSVDGEVLGKIDHVFTKTMLQWREATKRMSTYILPYAEIAKTASGRVHPFYTVIRTLTGRTSARKHEEIANSRNAQNLDRELKSFFGAAPGHWLVKADYQAIEFWVAVWMAGVQRLIDGRKTGAFDPHKWFASRLYDRPEEEITTDQRQIAKSAHFALLYKGGPSTLVHYMAGLSPTPIHITLAQADIIYRKFHHEYPEFTAWHSAVKKEMTKFGYVESPTGRRRHTGDVSLLQAGGSFEDAQREASNALVQGFSTGDIAELGLISSHQAGLPVCGYIHDELLYDYDREPTEADYAAIRQAMITEPVRILKEHFNVDFPAHLLGVDIKTVAGVPLLNQA